MGLWMTMLTGILFPGTLVASAHPNMFILLETLAIGTLTILDLLGFYALFAFCGSCFLAMLALVRSIARPPALQE